MGGLDSFICGHIYGEVKSKKSDNRLIVDNHYRDVWKFQEDLLYYSTKVTKTVAFNADYDLFAIEPIVKEDGNLRTDSKVIVLNLKNNRKIWDLTNLVDRNLEYWMNNLKDMPKYKKFNLRKLPLTEEYIDERNRLDTIATWALADFLFDYFKNTWGSRIQPTIGSTALNIFKTHFLKYTIEREYDPIIDGMERASYHGGRNEILYRGLHKLRSYDVVSMYVDIMHNNYFPLPDSVNLVDNPDNLYAGWKYYYNHYLGVFDVLVKVPKMFLCPLPVTYKVAGIEKIVYPYGYIRGVYTNSELKMAEKYGCTIEKVYSFLYYTKKDKMFSDFAAAVWDKRAHFRNKCYRKVDNTCNHCDYKDKENECNRYIHNPEFNKGMDDMTKKTGNSCYGKMSQQIRKLSYYGKEQYLPKEVRKAIQDDMKLDIDERKLTVRRLVYNDTPYVFVTGDDKVDSKHSFSILSSFVASYARMKWYEMARYFKEYIAYGDTDSIKVLDIPGCPAFEGGNNLGDFQYEYTKDQYLFAPKNYEDKTEADKIPNRTMKSVPKAAKLIDDNPEKGTKKFLIHKPRKFKTAVRDNLPMAQWTDEEKEIEMYDDKRKWSGELFYKHGTVSQPYYMNIEGIIEDLEL